MIKIQTNHGTFTVELLNEKAPETCKNFISYVNDGFYNGTIFHRVIKGFMIQGGGFTADMAQKPTKATIQNEADNQAGNSVGTLAMARTSDPHSATAQFFINVADNDFLNHTAKNSSGWGYCVFGKVTDGMDVVRNIENVDTNDQSGHQNVPKENVIIESIEVIDE